MERSYFVVTDPQAGWDCVRGIYHAINEEEVVKAIWYEYNTEEPTQDDLDSIENDYVVHQSSLHEV